jgi:OPC-8:0 CoA ligase 1
MEMMDASGYCAATGTYRSHHSSTSFDATKPLMMTAPSFPVCLFSRLQTFPANRAAFVDASTGAALSFADLRALSLKAASALAALGLRRGHVVLLVAPTSLHYPAVSLAVLALGAVLSAANPLLTPDELAGQARDAEPFLVLTTAGLAPKLQSLRLRVVVINHLLASVDRRDEWAASDDDGVTGRDDPALLFYSSGTTGRSKGVVTTHGNAIAMAASLDRLWHRCDADDDDVYGCVLPMFHMFGFSAFVLGTVAMGATTVTVNGRFSVDRVMAAVADYGITRLLVVPPMLVQMVNKVAAGAAPLNLRLREVVSSGAPLLLEHVARFRTCFPRVSLSQVSASYK